MKKVSTVGTKATKNFSQHKLTIGLDLGDRVATACWTKWGGAQPVSKAALVRYFFAYNSAITLLLTRGTA